MYKAFKDKLVLRIRFFCLKEGRKEGFVIGTRRGGEGVD